MSVVTFLSYYSVIMGGSYIQKLPETHKNSLLIPWAGRNMLLWTMMYQIVSQTFEN